MRLHSFGRLTVGMAFISLLATAAVASKTQIPAQAVSDPSSDSTGFPALQATSWKPFAARPKAEFGDSTVRKDQALIPLPPAAWTGMSGIAMAGIVASRRAIFRFVTA